MKAVLIVLIAAGLASAASLQEFRTWAQTHGKVYTAIEEARRFAIFKENEAIAERLNLEGHAVFGMNKFADLTNEEFKTMYTTKMIGSEAGDFAVIADNSNAEADYKYMLPSVKDQGSCGSCWAFSAVANAEGQHYQSAGKVVSLSEQQLVSCDKTTNMGCNGGNMYYASEYIVKHGLASESAYPYKSSSGVAPACKTFTPVAYYSSARSLGRVSSDSTLIKYVEEYGPLSIAIEADKSVFQLYSGGVLDSTSCGTSTNHGVTLVGFGTDKSTGKNYWTVRNSWGSSYGTPNETTWPGISKLPGWDGKFTEHETKNMVERIPNIPREGVDLVMQCLFYPPRYRLSAIRALLHPWLNKRIPPVFPGNLLNFYVDPNM